MNKSVLAALALGLLAALPSLAAQVSWQNAGTRLYSIEFTGGDGQILVQNGKGKTATVKGGHAASFTLAAGETVTLSTAAKVDLKFNLKPTGRMDSYGCKLEGDGDRLRLKYLGLTKGTAYTQFKRSVVLNDGGDGALTITGN